MIETKLILGDCLEKLKDLQDESVDLVLTDPPYALISINKRFGKEGSADNDNGIDGSFGRVHGGFMGKQWDSEFPKKEIWLEIKRVMKSGAFLVFTMTPRQDCLLDCYLVLREAGFNLGFSQMQWLYFSGFPKASDISKQIDRMQGFKGKVVGLNPNRRPNCKGNEYVAGGGKNCKEDVYLTEPESEEAKRWFGWKSCSLKPAVEVIVVAQKPRNEKTIAGQVLKNGCGAINIEECRIPYANENELENRKRGFCSAESIGVANSGNVGFKPYDSDEYISNAGRFPANLLVSDNALKGESVGAFAPVTSGQKGFGGEIYGKYATSGDNGKTFYSDKEGNNTSPSRFFDLDRWAEKHNITLVEGDSAYFAVPKPAKSEKEENLEELEGTNECGVYGDGIGNVPKVNGVRPNSSKNFHPTTKPVKLFAYLAKLFCQPKGVILDPFMGSGTTGISCLQQGFSFIGVEQEADYFRIAEQRVGELRKQTKLGF